MAKDPDPKINKGAKMQQKFYYHLAYNTLVDLVLFNIFFFLNLLDGQFG